MLSETQIEQYHEDGYIIPDFRLPDDILDDIGMHHARLVARRPEYRNFCPSLLAHETAFLAYARIPEILDMVGQVIGPDFALWNSSFFAKPALDGLRTPWHQDGEYWPVRPLATCTVWMAIDAATRENGCLRVIRGSHKDRRLRPHDTYVGDDVTLKQELRADEYDEAQAVDIVLERGQISLHDVYLLHESEANTSENSRRGMTLRYMPTTSVFDRDVARQQALDKGVSDHSDRTVFLMRGGDPSGKNDFRVRL